MLRLLDAGDVFLKESKDRLCQQVCEACMNLERQLWSSHSYG